MPNPDGSPTREELIAANPGLAPGPGPTPAPVNPLMQQMRDAGVLGMAQDIAAGVQRGPDMTPGTHAAPPMNPLQSAAIGIPSLEAQKGRAAPVKSIQHLWNTTPTPETIQARKDAVAAPVTYQGSGGAALQQAAAGNPGFFVPAGAGAGKVGKPANPVANQLAADVEAKKRADELAMMQRSDNAFQGEALTQHAAILSNMQKEAAAREEVNKARVENASNAYQTLLQHAPNESIDSERFFKNRSTGKAVAQTMAAMLAGFAAGFNGQQGNFVLDKINREVERDIDEQRQNIANRKEAYGQQVQGAKTVYEQMRQATGDDRAAADYTKAFVLDRMALELKQRALLTQDVNVQQNLNEHTDAIEGHSALLKDRAAMSMAQGGGGPDIKEYRKLVAQFVEKGDSQADAELRAARITGLTNRGGNLGTLENAAGGGGKHASAEERQFKIDAQNKAYEQMHRNPVVRDNADTSEKIASALHLPSVLAPETAKHEAAIESVNMQANAPIMGAFKDNEGRIPPAVVDALHNTDISINDPPEVKAAKLEAKRQIPNTMAQFLPGVTPQNPGSGGQNLMQSLSGYKPIQ